MQTATDRQATMNIYGRRLDKAIQPLSLSNGTEPWSQWDTVGYVPRQRTDDGDIVKRRCLCGKANMHHGAVLKNRHTKRVAPLVGFQCVANHFPKSNLTELYRLKKEYDDQELQARYEKDICDADIARDLEYAGKYRCLNRPCRKHSNCKESRFCTAHRKQCEKQGASRCAHLANITKGKQTTWAQMVAFDVEWREGSYCIWMLANGKITCQYRRAYLVNALLNHGFTLAGWKADAKPVFQKWTNGQ